MDILNGGVTGGAYNAGFTSFSGEIDIYIEPESTIKKALLFVNSHYDPIGNRSLIFNNTTLLFDQTFAQADSYSYTGSTGNTRVIKTLIFDVTDFVSTNQNTYSITPPEIIPPSQTNGAFNEYYLFVVYENPAMPSLCAIAAINNVQTSGMMSYNFSDINHINLNENVSLAINSSNICDTIQDGSYVFIEGNLIGLIGGQDDHSPFFCTGVVGTYYYQNNSLFGLGNDIANSTMSGPDAIANIKDYVLFNNSIQIDFVYQSNFGQQSNTIHQLFLTYTTPCQPFEATLLTSGTSACSNVPFQLGVTVHDTINATYEWLPQTNLSCYDCPNPVFLGDSTINYTVRIWASDSCSKVLPVRVRVLPRPSFESIDVTESICGLSTGAIAGTSTGLNLPHTYQINNSTPQNNFSFSNLEADTYTVTVTDANGCSQDSTVQILEINNVQAAFTVNPNSGAAPLQVQTQNNSQNASQYEWFWSDQSSSAFSPSILLDTAGVYTLTLVASNGAAHCNDTATAFILVEEPFIVFAYTFVTDETEVYQIFLSGVSEFRYELYALDGKLVYKESGDISEAGHIDLWSINDMASAMYLFRIWVRDEAGNQEIFDGKVVVVR